MGDYMGTVRTSAFSQNQSRRVVKAAVEAYIASGAESDFERLFRQAPQPMWLYDLKSLAFVKVNQAALEQYGYSEEEFLSMRITDIRPRDEIERLDDYIAEQRLHAPQNRKRVSRYWRHALKNGDLIWVDVYTQIFEYEGREAALIVATDVTARKVAQERLDIQQAYFRQLFDSSSEAIVLLDQDDLIIDANQRFLKLFGFELQEIVGKRVEQFIVPDYLRHEIKHSWESMRQAGYLYRETRRCRKDGTLLDVSVSGYPIILESERIGTYLIYNDLTEKKQLLTKIRHNATHSAITGLINRREFERRLGHALKKSRGGPGSLAVLHVALDQFMLVTQTCGHTAGDRLLKIVTGIIKENVQSDVIAHLYGDEFGILLVDTPIDEVERLSRKIIDIISAISFRWDSRVYKVNANIGVAVPTHDAADVRHVLSTAEMACQVAKERGINRVHIPGSNDQETLRRHDEVLWLSNLHEALARDRFVLYAQRLMPVCAEDDGRDYEILIRMLASDGSIVSPDRFIPVAERFRLMSELDRWVIGKLFAALGSALARGARLNGVVSVNLSGETLSDDAIHSYIAEQFDRHRLPPQHVCFEITETAAIQNIECAKKFVRDMQSRGAKIALDDFGSGMSSFRYLRELPIDYLKIDGLFIKNLLGDEMNRAMTEAICKMAQSLRIHTIAECVEDSEILRCLKDLGVDYAQGNAIHKPEPWFVQFIAKP